MGNYSKVIKFLLILLFSRLFKAQLNQNMHNSMEFLMKISRNLLQLNLAPLATFYLFL